VVPAEDSRSRRADPGTLHLRTVVGLVPDESIAVADVGASLGLPDSEIRLFTRFLGLDRVPSAGKLSVSDMLLSAGEEALAGEDRSRVGYLIHAHTLQHLAPPSMRIVGSLRDKLGLGEARAFAMSHQSCVTGLYALKVAEALLRAEPVGRTALLLFGEKVLSTTMRCLPQATVLGDAAAACLVALGGPGDAVLGMAHRTLGEFYESGNMAPGLRVRYRQIYAPVMAEVMENAVRGTGLTMDDISLVLPHNVNRYSWSVIAKELRLPLSRVYLENVPKTSHCFCADPFVNLTTARAEGAVNPGEVVLMVSAGEGGTFGAVVVRVARGDV
jgi:3-oxoacyl-[acyl-carrier-protein] synthase-3